MIARALRTSFRRAIDTIAPPTIVRTVSMEPHLIDGSEEAFVSGLRDVFRRHQDQLEAAARIQIAAIKNKEGDISRLRTANTRDGLSLPLIGAAQTELKRMQGELRCIDERLIKSHMPDTRIVRDQYRDIRKTPRLLCVVIHEGRMVYQTDVLFGKDHDGAWRRIGRFEISFDILQPFIASFRWKNLDGPWGAHHGPPNIVNNGTGDYGTVSCPGTDANLIIGRGLQEYTYPELVSFSIRYPECVGQKPQRDYTPIMTRWPLVDASEVPQWYIDQFGA